MIYQILIGISAFLIGLFAVDWKGWKEHKVKNIFIIIILFLICGFTILEAINQDDKSSAREKEHKTEIRQSDSTRKAERKKDNTSRLSKQRNQLYHIDSMLKIHRKDSIIIAKCNTINNSPNAVIQLNKNGNNIVNQNLPEPKIILILQDSNVFANNVYTSHALIKIESKVAISNLYLEAHGKFIKYFTVDPQRSGGFEKGHTGKREGFVFTNLPSAYGTYRITLVSEKKDKYEIIYGIE
jgi:hypothetical protein